MELVIIVWMVGVLSTLKMLAETWALWVFTASLVLYCGTRFNVKQLWVNGKTVKLDTVKDGSIRLHKAITFRDIEVKAGLYSVDAYSTYCYLSGNGHSRLQINNDLVLDAANHRGIQEPITTPKDLPVCFGSRPLYWVSGILVALYVFLPTETTMKYMAGAYLVQSAYESDLMQEATPLAKRVVLNQLKSWAEDAPDLLNLLPTERKDDNANNKP